MSSDYLCLAKLMAAFWTKHSRREYGTAMRNEYFNITSTLDMLLKMNLPNALRLNNIRAKEASSNN
jgi:hypothetical protein